MKDNSFNKGVAAFSVAYTGIIALICIGGVIKAAYELFIGGYEYVSNADWLCIEIPYIFVWWYWFNHLRNLKENDKIYTTLND